MVRVESAWQPEMPGGRIKDPAVKLLVEQGREEEQKILRGAVGKQSYSHGDIRPPIQCQPCVMCVFERLKAASKL